MFDTLVNRICALGELQQDKMAVAFKEERLSYAQLRDRMLRIASLIRQKGVNPGDRVAFSAVSKPEMIAVYLGIQACGAVAVFLDKNGTAENMSAICRDSGAKLLLTDKPMGEHMPECPVQSLRGLYACSDKETQTIVLETREQDDLAELLFTTGTTGKPKGVMLSYCSVYHILTNTIRGIGVRADDVILLPLPLNHSFALRVLRAALYQGASLVLQNGFTFAREVENNVQGYGCNAMACVPASFEVLRSQMQDAFSRVLGGMRWIEFGAGSLNIRQRREIVALLPGVSIFNTWGSSESGGAIFCDVCQAVQVSDLTGSLGKPLEGAVEIRILDSEGKPIESDSANPGRMALKGKMQMIGYWADPDNTKKTLVDGWLLTGDMAYLKDGYVFMLGRADDIINVGGEKVSPVEVENIASQFSEIRECACIAGQDPKGILGQVPVLFAAVRVGFSEEALTRFLSGRMERYKLPQRIIRVEALPRNRMQKVDRNALRAMLENEGEEVPVNPVIEAILNRRSIRRFTEQPIGKTVIDTIVKCGYHAPSGKNLQSWRFTVLTKVEQIQCLKEAAIAASERCGRRVYGFENPQAMILVSNDRRNEDGCQDASCAVQNMMLAAHSLGLGSVWINALMTLRDVEPIKSQLDDYGIPEQHVVWSTVALGYPQGENSPVKRKPNVVQYVP